MLAESARSCGPIRDGVVRAVDLGEKDHELVAAVATHRVRIAHRTFEPARDQLQDFIADRVPMGVVDLLEAIEVDEQHADPRRTPLRQRDGALEPVQHQRPIRRAGQLVVLAVAGELIETADHRLRDGVGMDGSGHEAPVGLLELGRAQPAEFLARFGKLAAQTGELDPCRIDLRTQEVQRAGRRFGLDVGVWKCRHGLSGYRRR
jgi:hypothetical protein